MNSSAIRCAVVVVSAAVCTMAHAAPKAVLGIEKLDFGTIKRGDVGEKTVPVRNEGDQPFQIVKVNSSCPCVVVEMPTADRATVAPGQMLEIRVRYETKDRVGPQGAVIAIMTSDLENPALTLDVTAFVEALVVVRPPNGVMWGFVPRGKSLNKQLEFAPGNVENDIELLDLKVTHPGVSVTSEKVTRGKERSIVARFTINPDVPLGTIDASVEARVRVAGEEAAISAPFRGDVIGDVLVTPPAIHSPVKPYALGEYISKITVRSSEEGAPPPKLLGAMAVGAVKTVIVKTGDETSHTIAVHAGDNVLAGPQTGTVYVMTDSPDQPITTIPVYFRMGESVTAEPGTVALKSGETVSISLRPVHGDRLKIVNIGFEEDILKLDVTKPEYAGAESPATVSITANSPANPERLTSIAVIETDVPGGSRVFIPVAVLP